MQVEEQKREQLNAITHSPYYGCTVRVVSKARVSYEGVLDGISANKDRIFLKNVRVNANMAASPNRDNPDDDLNKNSASDTLNAVMIDHLTNDIHTYEQVCLNVRDIQELRLIQLPPTFHESKAKLRAIDPCLVDIRLSLSDEYETRSNGSNTEQSNRAPIARQTRGQSFGSNGESALISSSSNESSSSFGPRSDEKFTRENSEESMEKHVEKFRQLSIKNSNSKPPTLLAKKVLPKKIERRTDVPSINTNTHIRPSLSDNRETNSDSRRGNPSNTLKKGITDQQNRRLSPIRVTITSNLNPNAIPFFTQQRNMPSGPNSSFKFYERSHFRPRLPTVVSPDRSQSLPYGMNAINHHQQQQNYHPTHQRFIPPRQMAANRNGTQANSTRTNVRNVPATPPPIMKYRIHPSITIDRRIYPQQQQQKTKPPNNGPFAGYIRQSSLPVPDQLMVTQPMRINFSPARNNPNRRSTASIHSTSSLPYHYGSPIDRNQLHTPLSYADSIGSHRSQRTFSAASSCSSLSTDLGPQSIVRNDLSSSLSNPLPSFEEQYDFEKANQEFRRYLDLEELVSRCPTTDENSTEQQPQQSNSYKKEVSFFDRISCTATTGTAVGYTEMDEDEKNLETFGDDALLLSSSINDDEWQL